MATMQRRAMRMRTDYGADHSSSHSYFFKTQRAGRLVTHRLAAREPLGLLPVGSVLPAADEAVLRGDAPLVGQGGVHAHERQVVVEQRGAAHLREGGPRGPPQRRRCDPAVRVPPAPPAANHESASPILNTSLLQIPITC
eukprot:1178225-Prorocentrum_minimum.AAC.3